MSDERTAVPVEQPVEDQMQVVVIHRGEPPAVTPDPWRSSDEPRVMGLARAIASSDGWARRPQASLVVRAGSDPLIAAVGRFDEGDARWLELASQQLATTLERVIMLDSEAAVAASERLADALEARFGGAELRAFRFAAVPRGGLLVLGMLAYLLDLPHDRLLTTAGTAGVDDGTPLVLVDDVAVSGLRVSRTLDRMPSERAIVATLHAHPALRTSLAARYPRVEAFVSAYDLRDHAPSTLGAGYAAWQARWTERSGPDVCWIGQPDHVVYPWNEPDVSVWNDVTEREETGWCVVPPARCLKRRRRQRLEVQTMPLSVGPWRVHPEVVAADVEGLVVVGQLVAGTTFVLDGIGADIWRSLTTTGDLETTTEALLASYDADRSVLTRDVMMFADQMQAAGLLVEEPS